MKKFLLQNAYFSLGLAALIMLGLLLPPTPRSLASKTFSKVLKDRILKTVKSPRIILLGGSTLASGINSRIIRDSLNLYPVNLGINFQIGLIYMMDSTLPFVRSGDIVLVSPEYQHFYGRVAFGGEPLLQVIMTIAPSDIFKLRRQHWLGLGRHIPLYSFRKFNPYEYLNFAKNWKKYGADSLLLDSFNEYGDHITDWEKSYIGITPTAMSRLPYNSFIVNALSDFNLKVSERGAIMFVVFAATGENFFKLYKRQIKEVQGAFNRGGFLLLGSPERTKGSVLSII